MRLYEVIGKVLDVDPNTLSDESNAENTPNWDSLRHIEVIFAVESAFHARFTVAEITGLRKLGDIRDLLVSKGVEIPNREQLAAAN
ncbi:MAG: acyl carrier protein [Pseudomonadota bacterium]